MGKRVIFVVGHALWGKSSTLKYLTGGNSYQRTITINGINFYIRRMSNDDKPSSYVNFMLTMNKENLMASLCPNFSDADGIASRIVRSLSSKGYKLYFWVMKHQYKWGHVITDEQIKMMGQAGVVEVYLGKEEAEIRARSLLDFIQRITTN